MNYEERLYSTGSEYLDDLLERAFCDGYYYAQHEFAEEEEADKEEEFNRQQKVLAKNALTLAGGGLAYKYLGGSLQKEAEIRAIRQDAAQKGINMSRKAAIRKLEDIRDKALEKANKKVKDLTKKEADKPNLKNMIKIGKKSIKIKKEEIGKGEKKIAEMIKNDKFATKTMRGGKAVSLIGSAALGTSAGIGMVRKNKKRKHQQEKEED